MNFRLVTQKLIFIFPINHQKINLTSIIIFGINFQKTKKSSKIVGSLWDQSYRSNTSPSPFNEPPSKLDIKPSPLKEEPSSERKLFGKKSIHDLENLKQGKRVHPFTPTKGTNELNNLITPSSASKEESKALKSLCSSHSSCSKVALDLTSFALASNAASHTTLRPNRRSHHALTFSKTCPPIQKSSSSPSSLQFSTSSERKESFTSTLCSILTSWDTSKSKKIPATRFDLS